MSGGAEDEDEGPSNAVVLHEDKKWVARRASWGAELGSVGGGWAGVGWRAMRQFTMRPGTPAHARGTPAHAHALPPPRPRRRYYPTAEETFGKDVETLVQEEDAQALEVRPGWMRGVGACWGGVQPDCTAQ
jgi:hypothetical protein